MLNSSQTFRKYFCPPLGELCPALIPLTYVLFALNAPVLLAIVLKKIVIHSYVACNSRTQFLLCFPFPLKRKITACRLSVGRLDDYISTYIIYYIRITFFCSVSLKVHTLIMFYKQHCRKVISLSFSKFHSRCLICL